MRNSSGTRDKDLGVIQALLIRLNEFRMPRALKLKEHVDSGQPLTTYDVQFLKQALSEGGEARRLAAKHPKYQDIVGQMTALYSEILDKGAENERNAQAGGKGSAKDHHVTR